MAYYLNFYITPRKEKRDKEDDKTREKTLLFSISNNDELARAFSDNVEGKIPFIIDNSEDTYVLTDSDFEYVIDDIKETIEGSEKFIEKMKKEKEIKTELFGKMQGGFDKKAFDEISEEIKDIVETIEGQREYIQDNRDILSKVCLLRYIATYSFREFDICCNIT